MPSSHSHIPVEIQKIWLSPGHDFKGRYGQERLHNGIISVPEIECHAGKGLVGDRYYNHKPDFKGQITFFDAAVLEQLARELKLPDIEGALLRRNVLLQGIDLNALVGKQFRLGEVEFSGSEECAPCFWMDEAVAPGAFEWLKNRGGLRCRILQSGRLSLGSQSLEILSANRLTS
ncbi:MOSC domain-containing protein [Puniceicoccus vermicola]|uniref:Molybdenum cofactor biosysynthesis protein n=1 Tax=Puniceicoccus vermicola TaxID=388746 RepID=A0A7X1E7N9_9BACT|nr:molybdenum cofactor biosysynthesis protein [Puniceicoccus vermicola]MBC2603937.1 molybdenum cofactor biosysynthesis protein [Puniceicoccus vermicola]